MMNNRKPSAVPDYLANMSPYERKVFEAALREMEANGEIEIIKGSSPDGANDVVRLKPKN